jgi:Winged helix-turn-helix DNA-binding
MPRSYAREHPVSRLELYEFSLVSSRDRHNVVFNPTGKPRRQLTAYEVELLTCARSIDEWAEIALALTRTGVTQTEIARRTGLAQPTVSARILRVVKG